MRFRRPQGSPQAAPRLGDHGGTGKYKEAGGELKVIHVSETEAQLTFKIID